MYIYVVYNIISDTHNNNKINMRHNKDNTKIKL